RAAGDGGQVGGGAVEVPAVAVEAPGRTGAADLAGADEDVVAVALAADHLEGAAVEAGDAAGDAEGAGGGGHHATSRAMAGAGSVTRLGVLGVAGEADALPAGRIGEGDLRGRQGAVALGAAERVGGGRRQVGDECGELLGSRWPLGLILDGCGDDAGGILHGELLQGGLPSRS